MDEKEIIINLLADKEKETILNLLAWLSERHYLNETSLEYDYDENSYIDVISLSPEDIYKEYIDWLEIENN